MGRPPKGVVIPQAPRAPSAFKRLIIAVLND
jgi:hypothetical protein